jgi:hypothetical protein
MDTMTADGSFKSRGLGASVDVLIAFEPLGFDAVVIEVSL